MFKFLLNQQKKIHKKQITTITKTFEEKYNALEEQFKGSLEAMSKQYDSKLESMNTHMAREIEIARGQERNLQKPVIVSLEKEVYTLRETIRDIKESELDLGNLAIQAKEELDGVMDKLQASFKGLLRVIDLLKDHDKKRDTFNKGISRLGEEVKK